MLDADDILGVNTRQHLAQAHAIMQAHIQDHWMTEGVSIVDPQNTYIDGRATIGRDTVILPFTVIHGGSPSARTAASGRSLICVTARFWTTASRSAQFVETSQSHFHEGAHRHLAYLGNADVGPRANIGAGAITANFNGRDKGETHIGRTPSSAPARSSSPP